MHEWIEPTGGAERVLDEWARMYPDATIQCLWSDAPDRYPTHNVRESWMATSFLRKRKALALPLMSWYWRRLDVSEFDWILVSSHSFAHHVVVAAERCGVPVFVYVHTPARYLWAPELDPRARGAVGRIVSPILKWIDRRAVRESANYAANSKYIGDRIRRAWRVEPIVIYPPVDVDPRAGGPLVSSDQDLLERLPQKFVLGVSRFVPQKRLEMVIKFASLLPNMPLVICGRGPEEASLRELANRLRVDCTFVISPSDDLLRAIFRKAEIFVFPPVEDFGILPVEALALGVPCVVNSDGGAAESVLANGGGAAHTFQDLGSEEVMQLLEQTRNLDLSDIRFALEQFSSATFSVRIAGWMNLSVDQSD